MMTPDEMIAVIQAHKDGKMIQHWNPDKNKWIDYIYPTLFPNFDERVYRIRPELPKPREWWIHEPNGIAHAMSVSHFNCPYCVHVREVLE